MPLLRGNPAARAVNWCVYMIEAGDGSLYTGITTDIARRFREHCSSVRGARYFNGRRPLGVVFLERGHTRSTASKREAAIKQLKRNDKLSLRQSVLAIG